MNTDLSQEEQELRLVAAVSRLALRWRTPQDQAVEEALYVSTRAEEIRLFPWPAEIAAQFVRQQFHAQTQHYQAHYTNARWAMIELANTQGDPNGASVEAVGRVGWEWQSEQLCLIDIVVTPPQRGRGLGSALIRALQTLAAQRACMMSLHVMPNNPAMRLYGRLGFCVSQSGGLPWQMQWTPG